MQKGFAEALANWAGLLAGKLSASCGYVRSCEPGVTDINKMALLADERMYAAKAAYYSDNGRDRRKHTYDKA